MQRDTLCVHAGVLDDTVTGGANSPIYPSTATGYLDGDALFYPRYFNTPNQNAVAEKISALEQGEDALVFSSGMAAIATTFFAFLKRGDHVLLQKDLYGGTHQFIVNDLARFGIDYTMADPVDFEGAFTPATRMVYIESPSNPLLRITDIRAVTAWARHKGLLTVIDNTFASPVNQNPLTLGVDVVVHSGTKYVGGHSDLCCGIVVTSKALAAAIRGTGTHFGGCLDPHACHLLERSLKTLSLRVVRQNDNAKQLAAFLSAHAGVARVYYPGLATDPGHSVARSQMSGFGGMVAFEIRGAASDAESFQRRLKIIRPAVSLGGVESVICSPARTSHKRLSPEERAAMGVTDTLLRLSAGIEDIRDLESDLKNALEA